LITNADNYWNTDIKSIQKELQNLDYSALPFQLDYLLNQVEIKKKQVPKDYIIITDAIQAESKKAIELAQNNSVYFIQPKAENLSNVSIQNVVISQVMDQFYELKINLQSFGSKKREIPLSVSSSEKNLATTLVQIDKPNTEIKLTIPKKDIQATIHIEDQSLAYDNDFYLSISKPEKVALLAIGSLAQNNFLDRIFTAEEFHFKSTELKSLDYNQIENQEAIVLNELDDLPLALGTTLKAFYEKGGTIILIPNKNNNPSTLNNFVANFEPLLISNYVV
jgi:hypothetical protein